MSINATLIGQMITFAIFVWFTMRFVWPPLEATLQQRQEKIAAGLAQAEEGKASLQRAQLEVNQVLQEARGKANEIVEQAHKRAALVLEEAKAEAVSERDHILGQGRHQLAHEQEHAREILQNQVAQLALASAQKILQRAISDADQKLFLDQLA